MKLTRVTITGADDKTRREDLDGLTAEYPFVEWGLLVSATRGGEPRYPSDETFIRLLVGRTAHGMAMHLCGDAAWRALAGDGPKGKSGLTFQVNGFTHFVDEHGPLTPFGQWLTHVRGHGSTVILQVQHARALSVAKLLGDIHPNVRALWDESGGRGVRGDWPDPLPEQILGYAGGITPENVKEAIEILLAKPGDGETWIDMESGVRTHDEFDLDKVRLVLAQAAPYITGTPRSS